MDISKLSSHEEIGVDELLHTINGLLEMEEEHPLSENLDEAAAYMEFTEEKLEERGFGDSQIQEIQIGISQHLPVKVYAKECYNWMQMHEIRMGLLENVDTTIYENPLFGAEQMREIRMGLMDNLDAASYAKLILAASDMRKARRQLIAEAYHTNPEGFGRDFTDEKSGLHIRISNDCMEAFVTLPDDRSFSVHELKKILERNDIVHGIIVKHLQKIALEKPVGKEIKIAQGEKAESGKSGRFEYFFNPLLPESPKVLEDGRVDYANVIIAERVVPGTVLAKYHSSEKGKHGKTVTGIFIEGTSGKDLPPLTGKGFIRDEERDIYIATENGYVSHDEIRGELNVWNVYMVPGDVNRYNGHISYDGMVHIRGSVSDMAEIEASGDIIVEGFVEGAIIKAGKNVVIKGGVNAGGQGYIQAGGKVMGKFFESASIRAKGHVEGNYFLNCHIETDGMLVARGSKAKIMGGEVLAVQAVESVTIGNYGGGKTVISVGDVAWVKSRMNQYEQALEKVEDEIRQLEEGKHKIRGLLGNDALENNTLFQKTCLAIQTKEGHRKLLEGEITHLMKAKKKGKKAYIKVLGKLQEGVQVAVNGNKKDIRKTVSGITLTKSKMK